MLKRTLRCPSGHHWQFEGDSTLGEDSVRCPACGERGSEAVHPSSGSSPGSSGSASSVGELIESLKAGRQFPEIPGYTILGELGRGGMGVVYKARHLKLNRTVALKMVLAGSHASERSLARFLSEAEIAAGLQHSHIVQIYELGEHSGLPYITMEFVDGGGMAEWLAKAGNDYGQVAALFEKLARAAHWAHQRSIVHRDLKPANVLIGGDGEPKIGDFGLAKRLAGTEDRTQLTLTGEKMGTPEYMAPEQAFEELGMISPATDVYALGAMLYQAICGQVPIRARSEGEWLNKLHKDDPPSPAFYRPGLPRDLETICMKCLRKRPGERYASAEALAEDLRRFREGQPILAQPLSPATKAWRWVKRRGGRVAATALSVAALIAAGWWTRHQYLYGWETAEVFSHVARIHGEYAGVGEPLGPEAMRRRLSSLRVVRAGVRGQCRRLEIVDGAGRPTWRFANGFAVPDLLNDVAPRNQPCVSELSYNADGLVGEERLLDITGSVVVRMRYSYPAGFRRGQTFAPVQVIFLDESGAPLKAPTGVAGCQFFHDKLGRHAVLVFTDPAGAPVKNTTGVHAMKLEHDARGLVTSLTNLDLNSRPVPNKDGWTRLQMQLDARGLVVRESYLDATGQPVSANGVGVVAYEYDAFGNRVAVEQFAPDGETPARYATQPGLPTSWRAAFDAHGRMTTAITSGFDPARTGYRKKIESFAWKGQTAAVTITQTYEDEHGVPARSNGSLVWREDQDEIGRTLRYAGEAFDPGKLGFAQAVQTLAWGAGDYPQRRTTEFLDEKGGRAWHKDGPARKIEDFDEHGRLLRRAYEDHHPKVAEYYRHVIENTWPERKEEGRLR
ncbi:MAG: serine/threonine protein kinase, partial [Verrucomicrobiota bacterium]|nr:serine/threonine protein kinase [Verrucomicrobiota bacterium]